MEDYHLVEKLAQVGSVEAVFSASLYIHFDNFLETHPTLCLCSSTEAKSLSVWCTPVVCLLRATLRYDLIAITQPLPPHLHPRFMLFLMYCMQKGSCCAARNLRLLQTTHDITDICSAEFLSEVGRKTPLHTRFSTVVHESGSPESLRDTRGFSVKFYTNEGNWDFVGNNMPVSCHPRASPLVCFHLMLSQQLCAIYNQRLNQAQSAYRQSTAL